MWSYHCDSSILGGSALEVMLTRKKRAWLNPLDAVEDKLLLSCVNWEGQAYGHGKFVSILLSWLLYFGAFEPLECFFWQLFRATGFAKINQSSKGYMLLIWGFLGREHVVIESLGNLVSGCQCQSPNFIGAVKCRWILWLSKLSWLISCFVLRWPTQLRTLQACKDACVTCVSFTTFNRGNYERLQWQ